MTSTWSESRGRPWRSTLGALVLAAVAAVAIALLASTQGDTTVQAPDANDVEQQINELRDFIRENAR